MKKVIVHVVEVLESIGGTSNKLLYLSSEMSNRYDTVIICLKYSKMTAEFKKVGVEVVELNNTGVSSFFRLSCCLKKINPSYVISHFSRSLILVSVLRFFLRSFKHLHHEHGPATLKENKLIKRLVESFFLKRVRFVVNSKYTQKTFVDCFCLKDKPFVAYNPVKSRSKFEYLPIENEINNINLLHVGGMTSWRDQRVMIEAVHILLSLHINVNLFLIGDGPEMKSLTALASQLNVEENVFFEGYKQNLDLYYKKCHIYINSAYAEGFGIATAEAMLAGKLIVVANKSANVELVEDGVSGMYYENKNSNSLAEVLVSIVNMEEIERSEYAVNAYNQVKNRFTAKSYSREIELVLDTLI